MQSSAPAGVVYGSGSVRETVRVIARTALAYSNLRQIRWWLAYLDLPLLWLLTSTPILRRPDLVVSFGAASTQLDQLPASASAPHLARGRSLIVVLAGAMFVALFAVPVFALHGPDAVVIVFAIAWAVLLIILPLFTFAVPAGWQQWRGRGRKDWTRATAAETGRAPILFTELAAWPAKGGGRPGTGDGFELVRALAVAVARDGGILIATARSVELARKYCAKTGAVASPANPRLLRWP